jgi:hypothetical protein
MKVDWKPSGGIFEDRRWELYVDGRRVGRVIMWYDRSAVDAVVEVGYRRERTLADFGRAAEWLLRNVQLDVRTVPADVVQVDVVPVSDTGDISV